ncbi:phosphoglycerate mutase family protein [Amylibacter sp.]|nr:phosphoglycerate mutase family protein [Amylibacter sp.]MDB2524939.1 phosphoglycerate mutase family protein [Amylibacter sp.]MDB2535522.1 phosphoglycerate mutase family protein [Amylibacter sp.]
MTIYFIRHAQSAFNAVHDPNKPDPMIFDAPITALGETQAQQARSEVKQLDLTNVIVSPFTRTLQTAQIIFGNRLPFQINSEVREQLCNSCDVGSLPEELARNYPHLNFDHLDDCWWHEGEKDHRGISVEPEEILLERANKFADFLKRGAIHSTAIVSHGNFIRAMTGIKPNNCEVIKFDPRYDILGQS